MSDLELNMVGYLRLGKDRPAFDDWLRAEGLIDKRITRLHFGEGYVVAYCLVDPPQVDSQNEPLGVWKRIPVLTSPPPAVRAHLDGRSEG